MTDKSDLFGVAIDLAQAIQASTIYPEHHQRVQSLLARLHSRIQRITASIGTLHLGLIGDHFIVDEYPFLDANPALARLLRDIREKGMEKISFREGITFGELRRFVHFLSTGKEDSHGRKWENIDCGAIHIPVGTDGASAALSPTFSRAHILAGATDVLKDLLESLSHGKKEASTLSEGKDIVSSVMKGLRQDAFLIHQLMRLQTHDDYTVTHSLNVCAMVLAQAMHIGLPENRMQEIGLSAMLHDIGKQMIPSEILQKPGRIDAEEFSRMAEHPVLGANQLRKIDCGSDLPMIVCFEHHVRHDHTGYPKTADRGLLHPVSCMTQIADVYDALRTYRPYRKSLGVEEALTIMKEGKGTEFEPVLFDNFLGTLLDAQRETGA